MIEGRKYSYCQAPWPWWKSSNHRGKPPAETTADHSQPVQAKSAESVHAGSRPARLLVPVYESQAEGSISNYHQAINPASISFSTEEAQISAVIFSAWRAKNWTQRTNKESHQLSFRLKQAFSRDGILRQRGAQSSLVQVEVLPLCIPTHKCSAG